MSQTQYVGPNAVYPAASAPETMLQQIIPSYLYQQYQDDDNLQALVIAQNEYATQFLLWFNTLNLPIYTGGIVSGALLDWVGQGLYGVMRPIVTSGTQTSVAATGQYKTGNQASASRKITSNQTQQTTTDDIYRRVITWNFYKGDGFVFSTDWLKRRVYRFLYGANGVSPTIDQTFNISVSVSGNAFTIYVFTTSSAIISAASFLSALLQNGACYTPFQYTFTLSAGAGLGNNGGELYLLSPAGLPTTSSTPGAVYNDGMVPAVVPGITPNPNAPPVYYGQITSLQLAALGGGNLPLTSQTAGSLQLWNNDGAIAIS